MSEGAEKGDPISLIVLIIQAFILMLWLGTNNTAVNPVAGNVSVTTQYNSAFTNTEWVLWLLAPLSIYMIATQGFKLGRGEDNPNRPLGMGDDHVGYNPATGALEEEE